MFPALSVFKFKCDTYDMSGTQFQRVSEKELGTARIVFLILRFDVAISRDVCEAMQSLWLTRPSHGCSFSEASYVARMRRNFCLHETTTDFFAKLSLTPAAQPQVSQATRSTALKAARPV